MFFSHDKGSKLVTRKSCQTFSKTWFIMSVLISIIRYCVAMNLPLA